jgi:NitT/TauT family transport system substrate-binding protein
MQRSKIPFTAKHPKDAKFKGVSFRTLRDLRGLRGASFLCCFCYSFAVIGFLGCFITALVFAENIRIGIPGLSAEFTPVWAAKDRGRLKKYGLDAEIIVMQGGTQLVQALVGGSLDFAVMGGAYLTGAVRGADLVMVATHMDKFPYSLIVKSTIKRAEDLRGARLAISRFGSSSDAGLRVVLQRTGMNPDKDVTILQVGGQTERYAALRSGVVDGTVVIPPLSSAAQRAGFNSIFNMAKLDIPYPQEGVVASRQYIAKRRDTLLRFLRGFLEAVRDLKAEKEFAIAVMSKHLRMDPKQDRQALEDSFREVVIEQMLKIPYPSVEAIKMGIELLGKDRPAKASSDPKDYIDASLMQELDKTGFPQSLYK